MWNTEINNNIDEINNYEKSLILNNTKNELIKFNENDLFMKELSLAMEKDMKPNEEKYIKFFNDILV